MRLAGLILVFVVAVSSVGRAQLVYLWTFDRLTAKADCVVIAEQIRTTDTGRRTTHPELKPGYPVVELETALNVLTVLKPCGTDTTVSTILKVRHYKLDRERLPGGVLNGGGTLDFSVGAAYLMFLRHIEGNLFEPVTGHTQPEDSVYRVRKPLE